MPWGERERRRRKRGGRVASGDGRKARAEQVCGEGAVAEHAAEQQPRVVRRDASAEVAPRGGERTAHLVRVRVGAGAGVRDRGGVRIRVRVRVHPKASAAPWCGAWRAVLRSPCYTPG